MNEKYNEIYDPLKQKTRIEYDIKTYKSDEDSDYIYLINIISEDVKKFNKNYFYLSPKEEKKNEKKFIIIDKNEKEKDDIEKNKSQNSYQKGKTNNNYKQKLDQILKDLKTNKSKIKNLEKNTYNTHHKTKKGEIPIVDANTPITAYDYVKKKKAKEDKD